MNDASRYLMFESQGPWAGPNAGRFLDDACALAEAGHEVCVFLVQDGVFSAAPGAPQLRRLAENGAQVWADDFSVAQRALHGTTLSPHVTVKGMDAAARLLLADDCRNVWH
ncbi:MULTISPECIES: DsrE family protein [Streptomyces]|uniref:DsrE family protein n=1 Tax=Streptomyces TaxID=1883 RepID=UPI00163BA606|nr:MULTISPECIES: DsrE family protein [Streptomyces]MBC2875736.1 DsrE family protein [Streptomyces sp. TYQ1024]UBI37589.1 DsrE family protein [Streptomyces mobaraensis]UKW30177.1 DsrE family protein [Streptomyces sp. TYQ1024]